jgi:transposase
MTSIARENGVSVNTVQRVLDKCSSNFHSTSDPLPEHLAFDEFKGVGTRLHFICLDCDKHTVVTILPNRYKRSIIRYFEKYSAQDRERVKTVSMDLNCYYGVLARRLFPNAEIIIGRFHLVQMVTRSFNSYRVLVMKQADKNRMDPEKSLKHRIYKGYWKLFLKKYTELKGQKQFYDWLLKCSYTPAQIVDKGLEYDDVLRSSYDFMQDFMIALQDRNSTKIAELLDSDINQYCDQLKTTIRTFRKNRRAVINAAKFSYSNGCLEGFNRKIKQIQRTAFVYRNLTTMLKRIRLEQKNVPIQKAPSKRICLMLQKLDLTPYQ